MVIVNIKKEDSKKAFKKEAVFKVPKIKGYPTIRIEKGCDFQRNTNFSYSSQPRFSINKKEARFASLDKSFNTNKCYIFSIHHYSGHSYLHILNHNTGFFHQEYQKIDQPMHTLLHKNQIKEIA